MEFYFALQVLLKIFSLGVKFFRNKLEVSTYYIKLLIRSVLFNKRTIDIDLSCI